MIEINWKGVGVLLAVATVSFAQQAAAVKPAKIEPFPIFYPPVEFDHRYSGTLVTTVAKSAEEVGQECSIVLEALGCSIRAAMGGCWIILAPEDIIKAHGWTREAVIRHEVAHCNGWHADHRGWRRREGFRAST